MVESSPRFRGSARRSSSHTASPVVDRSACPSTQNLDNEIANSAPLGGAPPPPSSSGVLTSSTHGPSIQNAAGMDVYANHAGVCAVPGCDATRSAGSCFVCQRSTCCEHRYKVRVVARLGSVEPVHLCCSCLNEQNMWRPDGAVTQCFDCSRRFMFFRRRHHCRVCGNVFCDDCTKYRGEVSVTHPKPKQVSVRMCLPCSDGLKRGMRCRAPTVVGGSPLIVPNGAPSGRHLDTVLEIDDGSDVGSDVFERYCRARDEYVSQSKSAAAHALLRDQEVRQARCSAVGGTHLTASVASDSSERDIATAV
mmetsp:Transcript_9660/g.29861  ORF Transcript_9660/g.29861 Transcript_9660/m.29861 type:complete len:307 (-) Transcript_9660:197-1117(-)